MSPKSWAQKWDQISDKDLESAARYYMWLAQSFPDLRSDRLDEVISEASRRGKPEIIECARASIQRGQAANPR